MKDGSRFYSVASLMRVRLGSSAVGSDVSASCAEKGTVGKGRLGLGRREDRQ